jgi:DNA-binding NarL/FixJ family response regulator
MRVIVAEDQLLTREGIVSLLEGAGVEVVAQVGDADELLRQIPRLLPDIAIMDIRMPPTHTDEGLIAAARIRANHPQMGVLVLSQYVEVSYALRLLEHQPERIGYLLKERISDVGNLTDALSRIAAGETVLDPTIVAQLMGRQRRNNPLGRLTEREREVLALVAEGRSNKGVALRLFVTERTIEAHLTQIFAKLGLSGSDLQHRRVLAVVTFLRS